ncbi:low molecular weight protein-tyrosine-phosphatase [Streptococcus iniae]|uniref:protein-tyrosine-phosphatase n=2 Tax=Streptococcus iniae TaxID=1346 RepID=A0ABM5QG85_STRIN|nr:low molecular weight protein-tyrosine-phosphatase [Streptococcus iniae]AHY14967.1 protein tyrosine phosphatase [Streptococcus iniae]AHY16839.1 protein tyrosine phosphatase [Streptococcus iniae]AJG25123.1 protein tyrosine phosphatase [Streptococcus iniae]APD31024.1 protein tyrosine phosphatase [Streptococcus iniae]ELY5747803.1 low molecular weight phosphotyrosine protein phosphatase [Streptococcus iniae]
MMKVCFVCLGNICRSTMAEFVMKSLDESGALWVESRGTSSWEQGNPIHQGTQKILIKYGIPFDVTKQSQQIKLSDLKNNDLLIAMDTENLTDLLDLSNGQWDDKIKLFVPGGVPDPWYTGDFEETYQLVMEGCRKWLSYCLNRLENVENR